MQNILILGGTHDALRVATFVQGCCNNQSRSTQFGVIYSIAGLARRPDLNCDINVGGFGGWQGLQRFLRRHRVVLLVDVTHPYAAQIKVHAQRASAAADIPLYRYARPEWQQGSQDRWQHCNSLDAIIE
ncbi:MAG: precorrin-6A/cobalt-precorrin-6A reductase, partial [Thiohalomonadales bacterium]